MALLERARALCPLHAEDQVLREYVKARATEPYCSYCAASGSAPIAIPLDVFMDVFMIGVGVNYQPYPRAGEDSPTPAAVVDYAKVAREILQLAGVAHRELARDVMEQLSATPRWLPRDHTRGSRVEQLTYSWETFKQLVKHEMRFFFAKSLTGSGGPNGMTAEQLLEAVSDVGQNTPAVWPVPCPTPIFRARMARSKSEAAQWCHASELGPPPPEKAAANRMSPAGISIFYGATDRATAIAEAGSHTFYRWRSMDVSTSTMCRPKSSPSTCGTRFPLRSTV